MLPIFADAAAPAVVLTRLDTTQAPMHIDGKLDEPGWRGVPNHDQFLVLGPDTLATPPYATRVRIFHTDRGIADLLRR